MVNLKMEENRLKSNFDVEREQVFNSMAPQWDGTVPALPRELIQELIHVTDVKGKTVLDVGAGTGALIEAGFAADPQQWIACDVSVNMLKILESKFGGSDGREPNSAAAQRLTIMHADVHNLPLESGSVDRVICHNVFPHFQQPKTALAELFRVLCPDGILVINHFGGREFVNQIHRASSHEILRTDLLEPAEKVKEWLGEAGFRVTEGIDSPQLYRIIAVRPFA